MKLKQEKRYIVANRYGQRNPLRIFNSFNDAKKAIAKDMSNGSKGMMLEEVTVYVEDKEE